MFVRGLSGAASSIQATTCTVQVSSVITGRQLVVLVVAMPTT